MSSAAPQSPSEAPNLSEATTPPSPTAERPTPIDSTATPLERPPWMLRHERELVEMTPFTAKQAEAGLSVVEAFSMCFRSGEPTSIIKLLANIFAAPIRHDIIHRVVVYELAKKRGVVHRNQLNKGEVTGSHRKIRPQKRLGRARAGDIRSPVFRGGGRAFPRKTRDFTLKLNKKIRDFGMRSSVSSKYAQGQLIVLDDFWCGDGVVPTLRARDRIMLKNGWRHAQKSLVVLGPNEWQVEQQWQVEQNSKQLYRDEVQEKYDKPLLHATKIVGVQDLSVYQVLCHDNLIMTREALQQFEKQYFSY